MWASVAFVAAIAAVATWLAERSSLRTVTELQNKLNALRAEQQAVQRQLQTGQDELNTLSSQLQILSAMQRPQYWAHRLATLAEHAPASVVFTKLVVGQTASSPRPASRNRPQGKSARGGTKSADNRQLLPIQIHGFAADHTALIRLVEVMQRTGGWENVELIRAIRKPYLAGTAIAFELHCYSRED